MARLKGWQEAFRDHEVHNLIGQLENELSELNEIDESDEWDEFSLRAGAAVNVVKRTLDNTVPVLFNETAMRNLQGAIQNAINGIRNFRSDPSQQQHLNGVEPHIDSIVGNALALPVPSPTITGDVFSATAERFKAQVDELLDDLNEHATSYEKRLEDLTVGTAESQTTLEELNTGLDDFQSDIQNQRDAFEKANVSRFDEVIDELGKRVSDTVGQIEGQRDRAREILGLISEDALTTDYGKSAIDEGKAANRYRWASIVLMLVATGTLVWLVYDISRDGFSWESSVVRLLIAVVLFLPSGYLARESQQHRKTAGYFKRVALELSVLGPFIRNLDPEERKRITKDLVFKYFGRFGNEEPLPTKDD